MLWSAVACARERDAVALEYFAGLLCEAEDFHLACWCGHGIERGQPLLKQDILHGVAGLRVPAESGVPVGDRADWLARDIEEQVFFARRARGWCDHVGRL